MVIYIAIGMLFTANQIFAISKGEWINFIVMTRNSLKMHKGDVKMVTSPSGDTK